MKGRWRKDKRPTEGSTASGSFLPYSPRSSAAAGDATFWSRPQPSLSGTPRSSCRVENSSGSGSDSAEKTTLSCSEHAGSSITTQNSNSSDPQSSSTNSRGLRSQKKSCAEAPRTGTGLSRASQGSSTSSSGSSSKCSYDNPAGVPALEEDLSYFSRRRIEAAAGSESGTAAAPPNHLKNAAYAAAQSLRQSEQLLCDGAARSALKQALEGGSIYLPAFCCSHDDFSIFEALLKDLLLYALQQQQQRQQEQQQEQQQQALRQGCQRLRSISSEEEDSEREERSPAGGRTVSSALKREDGEGTFLPFPHDKATSSCAPAGGAPAAAEDPTSPVPPACAAAVVGSSASLCSTRVGKAPPERSWRELLRPSSSPVEQRAGSSSSGGTGDAPPEDAADSADASAAAGAAHPVAATKAGAAAGTAPDTTTAGGVGVINWSCHLKHENPSFSPTFQRVIQKLSTYFCVDVYASRLNMYMDGTQWKPLHHDSHAYSSQQQQREDFTVGASFGATRALEFVHVRSAPHNGSRNEGEQQPAAAVRFLFPQRNGDVFAFNADVNRRFKHGVPPARAATRLAAARPAAPAAARADPRQTTAAADWKEAGTTPPAARKQKEAGHQNGPATSGGTAALSGDCTRAGGASATASSCAGAHAEMDGDKGVDWWDDLEEIAATQAAAAARAAAAATDGNGPRFSIILWGRRRQLNERNASLKELGALYQVSKGKAALS